MTRLFGTDGIRGAANVDLRPSLAFALGRATAHQVVGVGGSLVVGQDTRRSGDMFVAAITAGATSMGADVHDVGVVPTPALAYPRRRGPLRRRDHGLGVPQPGRGQRPQGPRSQRPEAPRRRRGRARGARAARRRAAGRGAGMRSGGPWTRPACSRATWSTGPGSPRGSPRRASTSSSTRRTAPRTTSGPEILRATGARVTVIHDSPDGDNINRGCGATEPASLAAAVREHGADVGFALDGDADRCVAVDAGGRLVDGDRALGILALERLARGVLEHNSLVVSVLSNGGLQAAVEGAGGRIVRTPVGDKHILAAMLVSGAGLGGEKSGHVIVREHSTSGDGIVTALELLRVMTTSGPGPGRACRGDPAPAAAAARDPRPAPRPVGERRDPPGRHRRRGAAARAPRAHPRPSLGHRARPAGDGRGRRCRRRDRAGRRDRGARGGASTLAARGGAAAHLEESPRACAASSATPVPGRPAPSSSKGSATSSTGATTPRASPSWTRRASCSSRRRRASSPTSSRRSRIARRTRPSGSRTPAGRPTAAPTTSTRIPTRTAPATSR